MRTLNTLFHDCVEKYRDNVYLLENSGDEYKPTSYIEARKEVYRFAAGLMRLGVKRVTGYHCYPRAGTNGSTVKWEYCMPVR